MATTEMQRQEQEIGNLVVAARAPQRHSHTSVFNLDVVIPSTGEPLFDDDTIEKIVEGGLKAVFLA